MKHDFNKKRNEFDWEREIRKDEARIHSYLKELPNFIDLPNEEEMIMKKLKMQPDLIPQNVDWDNMSFSEMFDNLDEDFFFSEDWQKRDGADIYMLLEKLAFQWAVIFASELDKENMADGLSIICIFGKILARTADILDVEGNEFSTLKIALSKRIVSDINKLLGELNELSGKQPRLSELINTHRERLQSVREKMIDMLEKLRAPSPNGNSGNKGK